MARLRLRRPRRATVVFVEVVLAVVAAAVAVQSVGGYVVAGVAAVVGIAGLVRRRGRGLVDVLRDRLRDPAPAPQPVDPAAPAPGAGLGLASALLPGLALAEAPTRDGRGLGVVGDGQGFAAVLLADVGARPWAFGELAEVLTEDPARPAAVQLLVEQAGSQRTGLDADFGPSRTYRSLPVRGLPLWSRVLVVVRHEPAWAPETVAARGGGADGARTALTAVVGRTVARAARGGVRLRPAGLAELTELLRGLGDPAPSGEAGPAMLVTPAGAHTSLSVPLLDEDTPGAVLRAAAELDVQRCVLSLTASAVDHSVCAVLRLVAVHPDLLEPAAARLVEDGLATALPGAQAAGLVATLPLAGGARSLAGLVSQERM